MTPQKTGRQIYEAAILHYEEVSADLDTDEVTRNEVNLQITVLRTKVQDAAFDSITSRSNDLQELVLGLMAVAKKAQHGGIGDKITGITALTTEAQGIISSLKSLPGTL